MSTIRSKVKLSQCHSREASRDRFYHFIILFLFLLYAPCFLINLTGERVLWAKYWLGNDSRVPQGKGFCVDGAVVGLYVLINLC